MGIRSSYWLGTRSLLRSEWFLCVALAASLLFVCFGKDIHGRLSNPFWLAAVLAALFAVILTSSLSVVRHAERLAVRLGEPAGTLILTLAVTAIEATSISAVMLHGDNNPTLVRDTLFAVVMIILNGMVGLSLLLGAWRHREQHYNLQGANSYLSVIIPLAVLSLVLPNFTQTTAGPTLSVAQELFLALMSICLYAAFLVMQTGRHRGYFVMERGNAETEAGAVGRAGVASEAGAVAEKAGIRSISVVRHALLLAAFMLPVVYLAEQLAPPIDYLIETLHAPTAFGAVIIAVLVATPEAIGAVRAAVTNNVQRSVNIFLGSVLSTIGLTIPIMLLVSEVTGREIYLGLQNSSLIMLLLSLFLSVVTFASGRTNVLQGAVHALLFVAYLLLIVQD